MPSHQPCIAIRRAGAYDRPTLDRLAALDGAPCPWGEVLIVEVGGEPQAAIEIASGAAVADPFRPTAQLLELLAIRAGQLRRGAVSWRGSRIRAQAPRSLPIAGRAIRT
jgi:hypothetical protein